MSAADVAGRECWCAVLPARTRVAQSRHLVRGPGATALGRSDLATPGSARLRNHMHGISLLPIAQPGCKLEDTSTEAAPTQRQLGVYDGDPTIDLVLPPRSFLAVRPLTDDEIVVCRSFSLQTLTATGQPAAWAWRRLLPGPRRSPTSLSRDLDFTNRRVWIHGSSKAEARWGFLSDSGATQLARRMESLKNVNVEDPRSPMRDGDRRRAPRRRRASPSPRR